MKTFNFTGRQTSQALVSVLIVLAIVLTLGAALLFHSRSFRDVSSLQVDTDKAYSLAKSGIAIAESIIANNPCGPLNMTETYTIGEGTIEMKIDSDAGNITSTGTFDQSVRVLTKMFTVPEAEPEEWAKTYGEDKVEEGLIQLDNESGYYMLVAKSGSFDQSWPWVNTDTMRIRIDADGDVGPAGTWARGYDGGGMDLIGRTIQESTGEYTTTILSGSFQSSGDDHRLVFFRTDSNGEVIGTPRKFDPDVLDDAGKYEKHLVGFFPADGGGYHIFASSQSFANNDRYDILRMKVNDDGSAVEEVVLYGAANGNERSYGCIETDGGGFLIVGSTDFNRIVRGGQDFFVLKLAANGSIEWAHTYGGVMRDEAYDCVEVDGGDAYVIVGNTGSYGPGTSILLIKIAETNGDPIWAQTLGGGLVDKATSILEHPEGGYVICGRTSSFDAEGDILFIKTDSQGRVGPDAEGVTWAKAYGKDKREEGLNFRPISGGYLISGHTTNVSSGDCDILLIKTDEQGEVPCCPIVTPIPGNISSERDLEALGDHHLATSTEIQMDDTETFTSPPLAPGALGDFDPMALRLEIKDFCLQ